MKKTLLYLILLLSFTGIYAQGVYNNGAKIVIGSGTFLNISGGSAGGLTNTTNGTDGAIALSGTLKLEGNYTNNVTGADVLSTIGSGSEVAFTGTTAQTIGGTTTAPFVFDKLTVNNSAGISASNNVMVNGVLTLTTGLVDIGTNNFSFGPIASVAGTPSATNMIMATGTGEVRKEYSGTGSFTFPVGDNINYSPVSLSFTAGTFAPAAYAGLNLVNSKYLANTIAGSYLNRYWNITQTGISGFTGNAVFQYLPADVVGTEANISCYKIDPVPVVIYGQANTSLHQLSASGLTSLGTFTGGNTLVAPVVSNSQTVCYGFSAALLNATPATGGSGSFSYLWQESWDGGATWFDLTGEIALSYNPGIMFTTDHYRVLATDNGTPSAGTILSNVVIVAANPQFIASVISADQTICNNTAPSKLTTTTAASGGNGSLTYQWQSKTTGAWSPVSGATTIDYQPVALTESTQFRQMVTDGGTPSCGALLSNIITITVQSVPTAGSIAADQSICSGTTPSAITSPIVGSGSGTISYEWESSIDAGATWIPISGQTGIGYTSGLLAQTTQFHRITVSTQNSVVCRSVPTIPITITINPLPTAVAGADRSICLNSGTQLGAAEVVGNTYSWTSNPAGVIPAVANPTLTPLVTTTYTLVETVLATGCTNTNSVTVTVNPIPDAIAGTGQAICLNTGVQIGAAAIGGNTYSWTSLPAGYTSIEANPTVTPFETTTYTVVETITATGCTNTNNVAVTVRQILTAPIVPSNQTVCYGFSSSILNATLATGGSGPYSYQWQVSMDGGTTWGDITGVTTLSYDPGVIFSSERYRIIATDNGMPSCGIVYSNEVSITVNDPLVAATIAADQTICYNSAPTILSFTIAATGGTGPLTYQWQIKTTGNWSNISGATAIDYQPMALTQTTQFRQIVTDTGTPSCGSLLSNVVIITVQSVVTAGTVSADQSICLGSTPAAITSVVAGSGSGSISYRWEYSLDANNWIATGTTADSYAPGALTQTTYYRRIAISNLNGVNCESLPTATVTISINLIVAGTIAADQVISSGTSAAPITSLSPGTGSGTISYTWESSVNSGVSWLPAAGISAGYSPGIITQTTWFRRIAASTVGLSVCTATSVEVKISVDIKLQLTVLLEGPFNGTTMNNTLNTNNLIPLSSENAYAAATYNYTASTVPTIPNTDIVDWVLVDLRDAATPAGALPATRLAGWPKACFLKSNGTIVDLDGTSPLNIGSPTIVNNFYVVVRHRNHIAIMSAGGITLTGNTYIYDFSTAVTQAYNGSAGYKQIGTGVFGMVTSDIDGDGNIFVSDRSIWVIRSGTTLTYNNADLDFDGNVFVSDRTKWVINSGITNPITKSASLSKIQPKLQITYSSQVPENK